MSWDIELIKKVTEVDFSNAAPIAEKALWLDLDDLIWGDRNEVVFNLTRGMRNLQKSPEVYTEMGNYELALECITQLLDTYLEYSNLIMEVTDTKITLSNTVKDVGNYTYNVSSIYRKAMNKSMKDFYNMTGEEAIPILTKGIEKMRSNPDEYKKLNPSNGWGSYLGALEYLNELLEACKEHPDANIYVG